jgi:hypothetical protein
MCTDNPYTVPLTTDAAATIDGGADAGIDCFTLCHSGFCDLDPGGKTVTCHTDCTGRRPQGLLRETGDRATAPCTLGDYFATVASLEAASVNAFRIMADELARFGAPRRLVRAARRATRDERRHVRLTSSLARRFGSVPRRPRIEPPRRRALVDIAIENAVEGCVRETFGALLAHWQAAHAEDAHVRTAMTEIARDETSHSALAWTSHAWLRSKLSAAERRRVAEAMEEAVREVSERQVSPPSDLARRAGMPGHAASARLARVLSERLWGPHARGHFVRQGERSVRL